MEPTVRIGMFRQTGQPISFQVQVKMSSSLQRTIMVQTVMAMEKVLPSMTYTLIMLTKTAVVDVL